MKIAVILLLLALTSCEGYIRITGNVVNATGRESVEGAKVELLKVPTDSTTITRDSGRFTIASRMMGMMRKPKYNVRISKDGYQTFEVPMTKENIYLYKNDERFIFPLLKTGEDPFIVILSSTFLPDSVSLNTSASQTTAEDLQLIEELLQTAMLEKYKSKKSKIDGAQMLSSYKRQYIPYSNSKGERMVFVNLFCDEKWFPDWRTKFASGDAVMDGGDCFMKVTINLTTKTYGPLVPNGYG